MCGEKAVDVTVSAAKTVGNAVNEFGKTWSEAVSLIYSKTDEFVDWVGDTNAELIKYLINDESADETVDICFGFVKGVFKGLKDIVLLEAGCIDFYALANLAFDALKFQLDSGLKYYKDGYDKFGNKVSIHYFQSQSGKVFNVKVKKGWSNCWIF